MNVEHLEGGEFQVEFEYLVYTRERPALFESATPGFRIEPWNAYCCLDDIMAHVPLGVPMEEHTWDVLRPPRICAPCAEEGLGTIGIATSTIAFTPYVRLRRRKLPPILKGLKTNEAEYLPLDGAAYDLLEQMRLFTLVERESRPLLHLGRGDDLYATHINAFYLFDAYAKEQHTTPEQQVALTDALVRLTQLITKSYDGIASDGYRWHAGAFDIGYAQRKLHEDAAEELAFEARKLPPLRNVVSMR